jgi:hypothetical protein
LRQKFHKSFSFFCGDFAVRGFNGFSLLLPRMPVCAAEGLWQDFDGFDDVGNHRVFVAPAKSASARNSDENRVLRHPYTIEGGKIASANRRRFLFIWQNVF